MQSNVSLPVYFDDLKVMHTHSPVVQKEGRTLRNLPEEDFSKEPGGGEVPFGLSFNSYSRAAITAQNFKFNAGSELEEMTDWYSTPFRKYDPSLGRFHGVDALADLVPGVSPSHFAYNNPVMTNDPSGLLPPTSGWDDGSTGGDSGGGRVSVMDILKARNNGKSTSSSTSAHNGYSSKGGMTYATKGSGVSGYAQRTGMAPSLSNIYWTTVSTPYGNVTTWSRDTEEKSTADEWQPTVDMLATHLGSATSNFEGYLMASSRLMNKGAIKGSLRTAQRLTKLAKGTGIAGTIVGSIGAGYNISTGNATAVDLIDVGLLIGSGVAIAVFGTVAAPAVLAAGVVWGITTIFYESEINESSQTLTGYADSINNMVNGL